jgi:predicted methyltransferase
MHSISRRFAIVGISTTLSLLAAPAWAKSASSPSLSEKLATAERPEADRARDAGRKPGAVLEFFGVEPDMTAVDLIAAGGYYTEALSVAVGPSGRVYAQNTEFALQFRDGANEKAISQRLADDRLPNVERLDRDIAETGLSPGSVDVAITALNFHDIYNRGGADAATAFLAGVYTLLKPGGILGIVDHVGAVGADNEKLHRIDPAFALSVIEASEFELESQSQLLHNTSDDHTLAVFTPEIRGKTDRFVLLLRKAR